MAWLFLNLELGTLNLELQLRCLLWATFPRASAPSTFHLLCIDFPFSGSASTRGV